MIYRCEIATSIQGPSTSRTEVFIQRCGKPANLYKDRLPPFGIALCEEHKEWTRT